VCLLGAYRFLSIRMITSPIATIAIIAAAPMPNTYASVIGAGVGVGSGVACGAWTFTYGVYALVIYVYRRYYAVSDNC
jgi:hypothetical protein